ncbi:MAG TPA: carboxypeptidase-like regulatory domain-containing protein, partial [Candidatus Diapherotrites archaeon]|nr:carboxypeptidase-like regulatory domain-containing protein [Candidatus Diapherotrites archaeon]
LDIKNFTIKKIPTLVEVGSLKVEVDDEYGIEGLSGILISGSNKDETVKFNGYTDSSGIALFNNLLTGNYNVSPQKSEGYERYVFNPTSKKVDILSGAEAFAYFTAIPQYKIAGRITDQYNNELSQFINIEIKDLRRGNEYTLLGVKGDYSTEYEYKSGKYKVSAVYGDVQFQPQDYIINLGPEDALNIDFKTNTYRVTGKVYDLNHSGISGVTIDAYNGFIEEPTLIFDENGIIVDEHGSSFYSVKTDASGIFTIDLLPGEYTIRAKHETYDIDALIEWLKSGLGLEEESVFILLLRDYLSEASDEEKEALMKNIIESGEEYGVSGALFNSLLSSGAVTKYFFQPNQRYLTLNKNLYQQDFFREPVYNISGKFIDSETGEGVSGIDYWLMTSNSRMLYPQSYYKVNGKNYSNEAVGKVWEAKSFPDGSYFITGLLPGEYYIIPLKTVDEWQMETTEDGEEYWKWVSILGGDNCPWNYGYIFKPENIGTYLLNRDTSGLDIICYTGKVYGKVIDNFDMPVSGVKIELLGGEYKYLETDEGELVSMPKQTNTNASGIYLFEYQKPEELYTLHLFKETKGGKFYHYIPEIDPSKRTTIPNNMNWEQNFIGIEYPTYIISGNVRDTSGIPIRTEVYAEDKEMEPPSILHGWEGKGGEGESEIPKYTFSGVSDEGGNYEIIIKLPASYKIYPASHGYNYNPILYQENIEADTSGLVFIGEPIPPGGESTGPGNERYNISGRVIDAWNKSGISDISIDLVYTEKDNDEKITIKTDDTGFYVFDDLSKGKYFIYPRESTNYKIWPAVPYYVPIVNNNVSGLDFELILAYEVKGKITYEDGEPIPNLSILFTQSHSLVKQVNIETKEPIWNYTSGLFHPIIKEDWIGGKVIVNEGKHNLLYFNNENELVLRHGQYFNGNSIPVPPCNDLTKGLSYPIDVEHSPRQFFRIVSFGNKSIDSLIINEDNVKVLESLLLEKERFILCREDLYMKLGEDCYASLFDIFLAPVYEVKKDSGEIKEINGQVDYIRQHKSIVGLKVEIINNKTTITKVFSFPKTDLGFDIKNFIDIIAGGSGEADIILYDYTLVINNKWNMALENDDLILEG